MKPMLNGTLFSDYANRERVGVEVLPEPEQSAPDMLLLHVQRFSRRQWLLYPRQSVLVPKIKLVRAARSRTLRLRPRPPHPRVRGAQDANSTAAAAQQLTRMAAMVNIPREHVRAARCRYATALRR